jgi:hypothetical protein
MDVLAQQMSADPSLREKMDQMERLTRSVLVEPSLSTETVITIPTVVHVLYNNSAENISDAQIQSQIDILNEDFRRMNADAVNTPSDFLGVAADVRIEFCLATYDPNGNPTTGITRTYTSKTSFSYNSDMKYNSTGGKNIWDRDQYLNIWVCDIPSLLGYAQFPGGSASTDGIVVNYLAFGNIGNLYSNFALGRTATHEVGHWLNLYHIWGDGSCGVDDGVNDTPVAGGANYNGSPCTYPGGDSCPTSPGYDMFQNYMDYSDDVCMNLFTEGQKSRMRVLFEPGGARESLLTSEGCGVTVTTPISFESNSVQSGTATYATTNTITSSATISTGANISYISGTQITLSPGFIVQPGATFSASISSSNAKEPAKETPALPFTTWDQPKHHTQSTDFKIYPNPIRPQEEFFLEYSARAGERIGASIHTSEGRRIATLFNEYEITTRIAKRSLTLQNVPPGIYIVRLVSSQGIQTQKFVVQ